MGQVGTAARTVPAAGGVRLDHRGTVANYLQERTRTASHSGSRDPVPGRTSSNSRATRHAAGQSHAVHLPTTIQADSPIPQVSGRVSGSVPPPRASHQVTACVMPSGRPPSHFRAIADPLWTGLRRPAPFEVGPGHLRRDSVIPGKELRQVIRHHHRQPHPHLRRAHLPAGRSCWQLYRGKHIKEGIGAT